MNEIAQWRNLGTLIVFYITRLKQASPIALVVLHSTF